VNRWKGLSVVVAAAGLIGMGAVSLASAPTRQTPPPATVAAPAKTRLTIKKDTVIGIRLDQEVSSETARVEDRISAKVSRDVIVDGTTAIPAGARLEGMIVRVERPTPANPRGKLAIRFTSLLRPDNSRVALSTDVISREAADPAAGTLLDTNAFSTVAGGGARIPPPGRSGSVSGSPTPTPTPTPTPRLRDVRLLAGTPLTVHLTAPISVTIDRDSE